MKFILLVITQLLFTHPGLAAPNSATIKAVLEAQPDCESFVRYDDKYLFMGFGKHIVGPSPGNKLPPLTVTVTSLATKQTQTLNLDDVSIDTVRIGNTLWVLTYSGLEEWDLAQGKRLKIHSTYNNAGAEFQYKEYPSGLALYKNELVISHGRLGYSIFDTVKKSIVFQTRLIPNQAPMESMATGVTVVGNQAYLVLDNFTLNEDGQPAAFRGFVVVNLDTNQIESTLDGMDPGSDAVVSDGKILVVSFMGEPLWKYDLSSIRGTKIPNPESEISIFPVVGHPTGIPSMDDTYYYTCFSKAPPNGGVFTHVPMAIERSAIHLN